MKLQINCAMCGETFPETVEIQTAKEFTVEHLRKWLKIRGWLVELNGENIDIYCSKECAK